MLKHIVVFLLSLILLAAFSDLRAEPPPFICAGHVPQEREDRSAKTIAGGWVRVPTEGTVNVLTVFAGFSDERWEGDTAPSYAEDLFDPDLPGSFSHFYDAMSFGVLKVRGVALPKRYFSDHPSSYYQADSDTSRGKFGAFVLDILRKVDADPSVDFGQFDNDGPDGLPNSGDDDGSVDFLFINLRSAPKNFLFGPAIGFATLGLESEYITQSKAAQASSPIRISRGSVQEVQGFSYAVGVMAHEFGHGLGLPDLYNTSHLEFPDQPPREESAGIGRWGLMGHGALGWNGADGPVPFCAWSRERLGWLSIEKGNLIEV
ncbi:MAG: hypothetical protein DRP97_07700, partial [Candidatus Latescibacterota bacterium]